MSYHIKIDYQPETSVSSNELITLIRDKQVSIDVLVRRDGSNDWTPANSLPEILEKLPSPLPELEILDKSLVLEHFEKDAEQLIGITNKTQSAKKTDRLAIVSLLLALLSYCGLTLITAIPAVMIGHRSLRRIKKNPNLKGRWAALIALYLIYIPLIITIIIVLNLAGTAISGAVKRGKEVQRNLEQKAH